MPARVLGALKPFLGATPALADPGYEGAGCGVHVPSEEDNPVKLRSGYRRQ